MRKLVILGAGGHALEVAWLVERLNASAKHPFFEVLGFCTDNESDIGNVRLGVSVLGSLESVSERLRGEIFYFSAIGSNENRKKLTERANALGWKPVTLIDPSAIVSPHAQIGTGVYVGAGSLISSNAIVEDFVIVNYHCTIGHDVVLENFSQVASGCHVLGGVRIREFAFMGASSVILPQKTLGKRATLAAGAVAVDDIQDNCSAIGNPARVFFNSTQG